MGCIQGICANSAEIILSNNSHILMLFEKGREQIYKAHIFIKLYVAMSWSSLFESAKKLNCLTLLSPYFQESVGICLEFMKTKECSDSNWSQHFADCVSTFF